MNQIENYLTAEELMKYLKVSRVSITRYMKQGMPSVKLGGLRRFKISEVESWLKTKTKIQ